MRMAHQSGMRSRAAYKLGQLDARDRLLRPGQTIIDLGAAPGGWCQYISKRLKGKSLIVGVDLLKIEPLPGVRLIQGDFLDPAIVARILENVPEQGVDVVLSDLAPNISGIRARDEARCEELISSAREFGRQVLRPGGSMVVKLFEGAGRKEAVDSFARLFDGVHVRKPDASRSGSAEIYLVAKGYNARLMSPESIPGDVKVLNSPGV